MKLANTHISYCTNIHPGQDWHSHFDQLRTHVPAIKDAVSPDAPFGLGLRISAEASEELLKPEGKEKLARDILRKASVPFGGDEEEESETESAKAEESCKIEVGK